MQNVATSDANQLHTHLTNSTSLINATIIPNTIIDTTTHYNISRAIAFDYIDFTRVQFENVVFKNCTFSNCRFLSAKFISCKFHNCFFNSCDFRYSTFNQTSVNPKRIAKSIDFKTENNVGADVFGKLIGSLRDDNNRDYQIDAQYLYRIYRRKYKLREGRLAIQQFRTQGKTLERIGTFFRTYFENIRDWLYWFIAQYGLKFTHTFLFILIVSISFTIINYYSWSFYFDIPYEDYVKSNPSHIITWGKAFHYTFVSMSSLGYNEYFIPTTRIGVILTGIQTILGAIGLGAITTFFISRLIRF